MILDKNHEKWDWFVDELNGPNGCDFRRNQDGKETWTCCNDHELSRKILATVEGVDVEKTIEYFEKNGGYCDCEICFNVMC